MTEQTTAAEARRLLEQAREVLNRLVHWSHGIQVAKPDQVWPDGRTLIAAIDEHLSKPAEATQAAAQPTERVVIAQETLDAFSAHCRQAAAQPGDGAKLAQRMKNLADTYASVQGGGVALTDWTARRELFAEIDDLCVLLDSPPAGERSPDAQPVSAEQISDLVLRWAPHDLDKGELSEIKTACIALANVVAGERSTPAEPPFQSRVQPWMLACFGAEISGDMQERNHRFLEEALELVQAAGATQHEAHQLVEYVYGRPAGEKSQEVGGVMVTLAALCLAQGLDMHQAAETELARIWTKVEQIRAKHAAKPKHSPLPGATPPAAQAKGGEQCTP
jgi:hypothetical protein